ncbi:hypothetical protein D877_gp12 [Edwardsiella phage KF-1]|uniref:Uncharacterized protein n=2 Tax=Edwardsiella phage KF-1 TaxID=1244856 RepID=K4Q366_9CAUD|nr:hypothetical protein D877_gp12 [Edwardsiella phage KF-1]BAM63060.1 hypothetical protein [Edwardsiella phage KF-1]BAM63109.1 hypothetical protein [Edwardsiella phage IW-1]
MEVDMLNKLLEIRDRLNARDVFTERTICTELRRTYGVEPKDLEVIHSIAMTWPKCADRLYIVPASPEAVLVQSSISRMLLARDAYSEDNCHNAWYNNGRADLRRELLDYLIEELSDD